MNTLECIIAIIFGICFICIGISMERTVELYLHAGYLIEPETMLAWTHATSPKLIILGSIMTIVGSVVFWVKAFRRDR